MHVVVVVVVVSGSAEEVEDGWFAKEGNVVGKEEEEGNVDERIVRLLDDGAHEQGEASPSL